MLAATPESGTAASPTPRLASLDLLRLLAVVLVLGRHISAPPFWPGGWMSIFFLWRSGGWVGVDLFFVLSGFLVSGPLFTEYQSRGRFSIGRFYVRRGWRIYPPFFVFIVTTVLVGLGTGRLGPLRSILSHLRLDALFFGVMISYAYHFHKAWFIEVFTPWRRWLILGGALLLTPAFAIKLETSPFILTVGLSLFYIAGGMLLVGGLLCRPPRGRLIALLAALGASSYSIYLWQLPVSSWGIRLVEMAWGATLGFGARTTVFLIGSLLVGFVMARVVEIPVLRLRDAWFPRPSR